MDKRKTPIVKSNSTSEAKKNNSTQKNNKKSQSNAEFQARITVTEGQGPLKRRGVYVEKKSIKIPLNNGVRTPDVRINSPKIHRRVPRPDKKRFLTNVLTLLSNGTVGTQSFEPDSTEKLVQMENTKQTLKKKREEFVIQKEIITSPVLKRKHKHKSRSLKNHVNGELDSLIVLQSTKEIIQTPSNNSEFVAPTQKKTVTRLTEPKSKEPSPSHRLDLDIENNAPKASHSKRNKKEEHTVEEMTNREENNIYNFFVNVLQTTLSDCDVKPEFDVPASVKSSKITMEIDEAIAKKLNMENRENKPTYEVSNNPSCSSKCYYVDVQNESRESDENFKPELKKQYKTEVTRKRIRQNINTGALIRQYRLAAKSSVPKTKTMPIPRKKTPRRKVPTKPKQNHRRDFIDSLKQELQFHQEDVYEKPSFFQALKVIAKNKKKQSVNFRTSERKPSDENICQLKCRKVLSAKSSRNKKIIHVPPTHQTKTSFRKQHVTILEKSDEDSMHSNYSLEVVDYDDRKVKSAVKTNVVIHHPSDVSDEDFNFPVVSFSSSCCNVQIVA